MTKKQYELTDEQLSTLKNKVGTLSEKDQATLGAATKNGQITRVASEVPKEILSTGSDAKVGEAIPIQTESNNQTIDQPIEKTPPIFDIDLNNTGINEPIQEVNTEVNNQTIDDGNNNQIPVSLPKNIQEWKNQGSNIDTLRDMIKNQYGTETEYDPIAGKITGVKNGEKTEWHIDNGGNPIATSLGIVEEKNTQDQNIVRENLGYDELFEMLRNGQGIDNYQDTLNYTLAKNLYKYYNQFKGKASYEYTGLLSNGNIIPNTALWDKLMSDPGTATQLKEAEKLNSINKSGYNETYITKSEENQSEIILQSSPILASYLSDGFISLSEYQNLTSSPEKTMKEQEVERYRKEYLDLKHTYDGIEDDVDVELEETLHTTSYRYDLIAKRRSKIGRDLDRAYGLYQGAFGDLTNIETQAANLLNTNLSLYQTALSRKWQLEDIADERAYNRTLTDEQRVYNEKLLADERAYNEQNYLNQLELQYQYTYGDLNSNNPTLQNIAIKNAISDLYAKYPIVGMESQAIKEEKVKNLMTQGLTASQALVQVENEIRQSDSYNLMMEAQKAGWQGNNSADLQWVGLGVYDDYGNEMKGIFDKSTGQIIPYGGGSNGNGITGGLGSGIDLSQMSNLIAQYPNEASLKNNNPAGLTWGISNDLKQMLINAGIEFGEGGKKPAGEGGNYIKFNNIEDGLLAYQISLTQRGDSVYDRLKIWSAGGDDSTPEAIKKANQDKYAKDLMAMAGIPMGAKFSDLTDDQLGALMEVQIQRESPGLYNFLSSINENSQMQAGGNFDNNKTSQYKKYLSSGTMPSGLKIGTKAYNDFQIEATNYENHMNSNTQNLLEGIGDITDITFPDNTTEFKTKSYGYGTRMNTANNQLAQYENKYLDNGFWGGIGEHIAPRGAAFNFMKSSDRQQYEQAQRNFVNAVLRQESGAAISDGEFKNAKKQYFAQPGDSDAVIQQKKQNREMAINNMLKQSGKDASGRDISAIWRTMNGINFSSNEEGEGLISPMQTGPTYTQMAEYYFTPTISTTKELENKYFNN